MPLNDFTFRLGDTGTELNGDVADPFTDIVRVYGLDSAPIRETERDHEGVDGGFLDAEFEKGRPLMMDAEVYGSVTTLEPYLDQLKKEWAPSPVPVPFYFKAPGVAERMMMVKPRGLRYDWESNRRRGMERVQFVFYAEDPRVYDSVASSIVIPYGGTVSSGFGFITHLDTFDRTVSNAWGTANSGHTYTLTGTAANFSVSAGLGRITLAAAVGTAYFAASSLAATLDPQHTFLTYNLSALPTGGTISTYTDLRVVDPNNYYRLELIHTTGNTITATLIRVVGGVATTMAGPVTVPAVTATTVISVRFEVTRGQGAATTNAVRAKIWAASAAEPVAWTSEVLDGNITAAGTVRVGAVRNTSNTNVNPVVAYDPLQSWQGMGFNLNFGGGAVPSGGVVVNNGNRPTPAIMTIQGPIDNPTIANDTAGSTLVFQISLGAAETLVIDLANKTVLLNGNANRRTTLIDPTWFLLAPGNNFIRFGGASGGAPTLTIVSRSAWR